MSITEALHLLYLGLTLGEEEHFEQWVKGPALWFGLCGVDRFP